jgi:hypothetical protein
LRLRLGTESDQRGARSQHVGEVDGAGVLTLEVLAGTDRLDDLGVHVPVAQDGLCHAQMVFGLDAFDRRVIVDQRRISGHARQ